jgi:serine/threonine-protein kinase RsbW
MKNNQIELQIKVPNQTRYLSLIGRLSEELAAQLQKHTDDRDTLADQINVVLTEALVNAIRHANADNPDEEVEIRISITDNELILQVFDHGKGFDLNSVSDSPQDTDNELEDHGRGLFIMRSLMDSVTYYPVEGGNVLEMRKQFH